MNSDTRAQRRIDTHMHFMPPVLKKYLIVSGHTTAGGGRLPEWTLDTTLAMMDEQSIATGILSASAPGVYFGNNAKARRAARAVNEAAAELVRDRPLRFGFFATLTLPDVRGAIDEARYAFDILKADGVILLANSDGIYLGDPSFEPLMAELNARNAVIFVHPNDLPGPAIPGIIPFAADFLLDTTRAAIGLVKSGAVERYPNCKIILAHAGGFLPYAAYRMAPVLTNGGTTEAGIALLKRFYFDGAVSTTPSALPSLLAFADSDHVTYGTDWPWAPIPIIREFATQFEAYELSPERRLSIERGAAEKLFPRLARSF